MDGRDEKEGSIPGLSSLCSLLVGVDMHDMSSSMVRIVAIMGDRTWDFRVDGDS